MTISILKYLFSKRKYIICILIFVYTIIIGFPISWTGQFLNAIVCNIQGLNILLLLTDFIFVIITGNHRIMTLEIGWLLSSHLLSICISFLVYALCRRVYEKIDDEFGNEKERNNYKLVYTIIMTTLISYPINSFNLYMHNIASQMCDVLDII